MLLQARTIQVFQKENVVLDQFHGLYNWRLCLLQDSSWCLFFHILFPPSNQFCRRHRGKELFEQERAIDF